MNLLKSDGKRKAIAAAILIASLLLTAACEDDKEVVEPTAEGVPVSRDVALIARQVTHAYLSDKTWGFFGATCDQWLDIDYEWMPDAAEELEDGRVKIIYRLREDRLLGPETLIFKVDLETNQVDGDNQSESDRVGVAEGCDKW